MKKGLKLWGDHENFKLNETKRNPNSDETGRYLVLPSFGIKKETRVQGDAQE